MITESPQTTPVPRKANAIWVWVKMILNGSMIAAVVLGWLIGASVTKIKRAYYHRGNVQIENDNGDKRLYFEAEFKRVEYVNSAIGLSLGLFFWYYVAMGLKDLKEAKK